MKPLVNLFPISFNPLHLRGKHYLAFEAFDSHASFLYFTVCVCMYKCPWIYSIEIISKYKEYGMILHIEKLYTNGIRLCISFCNLLLPINIFRLIHVDIYMCLWHSFSLSEVNMDVYFLKSIFSLISRNTYGNLKMYLKGYVG